VDIGFSESHNLPTGEDQILDENLLNVIVSSVQIGTVKATLY
jgi:hypothetical protein